MYNKNKNNNTSNNNNNETSILPQIFEDKENQQQHNFKPDSPIMQITKILKDEKSTVDEAGKKRQRKGSLPLPSLIPHLDFFKNVEKIDNTNYSKNNLSNSHSLNNNPKIASPHTLSSSSSQVSNQPPPHQTESTQPQKPKYSTRKTSLGNLNNNNHSKNSLLNNYRSKNNNNNNKNSQYPTNAVTSNISTLSKSNTTINITKQDCDGRLQLFIVDIKRFIRFIEGSGTPANIVEFELIICNKLCDIATQFLKTNYNEITYEKYADDLLSILNSIESNIHSVNNGINNSTPSSPLRASVPSLPPSITAIPENSTIRLYSKATREKVLKLLIIIAKFARIKEFSNIHYNSSSADFNQNNNNNSSNSKNSTPATTASNNNTLVESSTTKNNNNISTEVNSILDKNNNLKEPELIVNTNSNNDSNNSSSRINDEMKSKNVESSSIVEKDIVFQKSHFRCLSYSPKFLETQKLLKSNLSSQRGGARLNNQQQIGTIKEANEKKILDVPPMKLGDKSPVHASHPAKEKSSSSTIVKPPLLSRRITDIIHSNHPVKNENEKKSPTLGSNEFIPIPPPQSTSSSAVVEQKSITSPQSHKPIHAENEDSILESSSDDDEIQTINNDKLKHKRGKSLEKSQTSTNLISSPIFLKDPRLNNLPLVRSKSFSPNKAEEAKKENFKKLARSFSEIPSIKLLEDKDESFKMAICRICEEPIHSTLLEEHSKICAMANEEDMKAMNVEDHLRAIAKILLTRSSDLPVDKRNTLTQLREIALYSVENGTKECLKMVHIMDDIINNFDPKDDNRDLAIKIQTLISEKVKALKKAEDVINSSPRIFRTNSPRILKSPRDSSDSSSSPTSTFGSSNELQVPILGRLRSDSDPVHINNSSLSSNSSGSSSNSLTPSSGNSSNEYCRPKGIPTISDFEFIKPITKGGYGKVFLAKKIRTGDIYAIKRLKKSDMIKKNQLDHVKVERNILAYTSNPFVVKMYYSFQTKDYYYLVMEYLQGGDCFSLLQSLGALDEKMAKMIIAETVLALEYLHSHGIIHRDLKPDNLLIDKNGHIKLTDFGLSKVGLLERQTVVPPSYFSPSLSSKTPIKKERKLLPLSQAHSKSLLASSSSSPSIPSLNLQNFNTVNSNINNNLNLNMNNPTNMSPLFSSTNLQSNYNHQLPPISAPMSTNQLINSNIYNNGNISPPLTNQQVPPNTNRKLSCVGTPDYLAPEILLGIGHGASADWFSLGVILYEFLSGVAPFSAPSVQETFQNILKRNMTWPDDISPEAKDIIDKLLSLDPKSRLGYNGAQEVKSHPFFAGINWDTIRTQEPFFKPKIANLQDTSYFEPRKDFHDTRISDDLEGMLHSGSTSSTTPNTTCTTPSCNSDINNSTGTNFDDFLYVNFQSLLELNQNYLAETKPFISSHNRRNSL
ncbi:hypothetical protein CYY_006321 [Polysphondylium violaceum]|uniref:non-specific serine/threonine protein kinase n=1 Tax=Polysphondylium violaceum TaxID=133409 RepID=A0A8J4URK8_9MYCE|nr:hypothetical protein CYY_006321 [Polysphondylium violaceum]